MENKKCFNKSSAYNFSACWGETIWQGIPCKVTKCNNGRFKLSAIIKRDKVIRIIETYYYTAKFLIDGKTLFMELPGQEVYLKARENKNFELSVITDLIGLAGFKLFWVDNKIKLPRTCRVVFLNS